MAGTFSAFAAERLGLGTSIEKENLAVNKENGKKLAAIQKEVAKLNEKPTGLAFT